MGVGREDFSDTANWQIPRELPDLRRVGIVALDTEDERRGPARRPRIGLAVARRSCCRHQRRLARGRRDACDLHTRCAIPTPTISIPIGSIAGSRIWSHPTSASSPITESMIAAGCARKVAW